MNTSRKKQSTLDENESVKKENDLDPRIQEELEKLNNATDEINKLEMELDEANSTFRMLMGDSMRKLKLLARKLGGCIERARPYYETLELAKQAQQECQRAAVKFQRANEIHQAAKETVALAEARFLSKQHEWEFDSAWQEMLNNAIMKVTAAEHEKTESGREHQKKATLFHAAEQKVQIFEQRFHRHITKSRPYFEEKSRCETHLGAQKDRVLNLRTAISKAKKDYSLSLRRLEEISEEIHLKRKRNSEQKSRSSSPCGPREPGVGAELTVSPTSEYESSSAASSVVGKSYLNHPYHLHNHYNGTRSPSLDLDYDLDHCDLHSGSGSVATSSAAVSDNEDFDHERSIPANIQDLEELRQKVRELASRPVTEANSSSTSGDDRRGWEEELNVAVQKLDYVLHMKEREKQFTDNKQTTTTTTITTATTTVAATEPT